MIQSFFESGLRSSVDKSGKIKPDTSKRDSEKIPLNESIKDYFDREVIPHRPESWIDESKNKIGYEINFLKLFYNLAKIRDLNEISECVSDILSHDYGDITMIWTKEIKDSIKYFRLKQ